MKCKFVILLIHFLGLIFNVLAQGDLLVTPTRIVFEGNKQREEINLVNLGKDTTTYSISFLHYNQTENGGYSIIEKPDSSKMIADTYLRFFPREVTLAPGEPQVIMLQYRRKADMKPGEYRSHLYFRSEKEYLPLGSKNKDTTKMISVQLIPIYGISIPVIIRAGVVNVTSSLTNLKLETQKDSVQSLKVAINREGNCSTYGDLIVDYIPVKGKSFVIGQVRGVKVFTDINQINLSIKLNKMPVMALKDGKLKVRYTTPNDTKYMVYAEKELQVNEQLGIAQQGATKDNGQ